MVAAAYRTQTTSTAASLGTLAEPAADRRRVASVHLGSSGRIKVGRCFGAGVVALPVVRPARYCGGTALNSSGESNTVTGCLVKFDRNTLRYREFRQPRTQTVSYQHIERSTLHRHRA